MTTEHTLTTKRGTWIIDPHVSNIVGNGAYGIVYKAKDNRGHQLAAKRIDTKEKEKVEKGISHLEKLIYLDHSNIAKVLDVYVEKGIVWMIMELCEFGNLNDFCMKESLSKKEMVRIMLQIANGVAYLHSNNIIHRDIKPDNILVDKKFPVNVKLTDFDVSKFLDEFKLLNEVYKTSAMSTNVGTMAFKAPEFFQRNSQRKLKYHRNVDIYAAGLTYLGLLQHAGTNKPLLPQIETPRDDSERHVPSIGQLIAERIKYKVGDLNVVKTNADQNRTDFDDNIRGVIRKMTQAKPESRLSADEVIDVLQSILTSMVHEELCGDGSSAKKVTTRNANTKRKVEIPEQVVEKRTKVSGLKLEETWSWETGTFQAGSMCMVNDLLVIKGESSEMMIRVHAPVDGNVLKEIRSMCDHEYPEMYSISKNPREPNNVLEACGQCGEIRAYDLTRGVSKKAYEDFAIYPICSGPPAVILGLDEEKCIVQLKWQSVSQRFEIIHSVATTLSNNFQRMCYAEWNSIVILAGRDPGCVKAVQFNNGKTLWEFNGPVNGTQIEPRGISADKNRKGFVFVADVRNARILVLFLHTGELLHVLTHADLVRPFDVHWSNSKAQLTVLHDYGQRISAYKLIEE